ncbi:MAG TPA: hypothetical protein VN213_18310 [Solirubrobacteraceae bacterium]|nr:hypothetical protein [Solirubrobacteraceae bacterium]
MKPGKLTPPPKATAAVAALAALTFVPAAEAHIPVTPASRPCADPAVKAVCVNVKKAARLAAMAPQHAATGEPCAAVDDNCKPAFVVAQNLSAYRVLMLGENLGPDTWVTHRRGGHGRPLSRPLLVPNGAHVATVKFMRVSDGSPHATVFWTFTFRHPTAEGRGAVAVEGWPAHNWVMDSEFAGARRLRLLDPLPISSGSGVEERT